MNTHLASYRPLTDAEITLLCAQCCECADWGLLRVHPAFDTSHIREVCFEGRHYLGRDLHLVRVRHLVSTGPSAFANGLSLDVLKEDGGKSVVITDRLTAMDAAVAVHEADATAVVQRQRHEAAAYADSVRCDGCVLADGVFVEDVRELRDVRLGTQARVVGAHRLVEVSLASHAEAPITVGDGVIMEQVIVQSGSTITDGAQLDHCFVGQGCHLGRMFSATQSLFFANCHFENGEACALFAGPYSVSHHKATLLIACQTSFFNAGSGSNQSNHSYKMGPNKWGQLERGSKLGSSSYLYWPMSVGAFTTVTGHHTVHADLRPLPFSLVVEGGAGRTVIVPGHALASVGTRRDVQKWPQRDHRHAAAGLSDLLTFPMLNPFTVGRIRQGIAELMLLVDSQTPAEVAGGKAGMTYYEWRGCLISADAVAHGLARYQRAVEVYVGQQLQARESAGLSLDASAVAVGEWADYGGLVVPRAEALALLAEGVTFADMAPHLPDFEWNWVSALCAAYFGQTPLAMTAADRQALVARARQLDAEWQAELDADGQRDLKMSNQ